MIGLILAATVAGQAPTSLPTPNLYSQPANCGAVVEQEVRRQEVASHGRPNAVQYAMWRRLEGCTVPTPVGYHPSYTLPGAADPTLKREDAPVDRR